jgi:hypothetical protein
MRIAQHPAKTLGRGLRLIELSNYAGGKADEMRRKRHLVYEEEAKQHLERLEELSVRCHLAKVETLNALKAFRLLDAWKWWRETARAKNTLETVRRLQPIVRSADIEEQQARVGEEAEKSLDNALAEALGERWTLIAGYCGRAGEIDRVLVGPWGVYAFEIKGNRGVICSDGVRWWVERYDRRGVFLGSKELHRAPDEQLAKAVKPLESWLRRNGITGTGITKVVLFAAEDARLGNVVATKADVVKTLSELDLGRLFDPQAKGSGIPTATCERIVSLVLRDHSYWQNKRLGSRAPADAAKLTD